MKKIDQALFGYDSGHHLLESSLDLSRADRHFLAVATDLSGSAPAEGFDQSYTGLPLPDSNYYALFCTWLAPEMPRPGCVWSHVLLLELADLAEIPDLGNLRTLFERPIRGKFSRYKKRVEVRNENFERRSEVAFDHAAAAEFLRGLYEHPDSSMMIVAESGASHEELVFALWSQQWPRLRRQFRFSTGSFSDRGKDGDAFDLQILPRASRSWQVTRKLYMVDENLVAENSSKQISEWISAAVKDLASPLGTPLRDFLQAHGLDIRSPRGSFKKLTEIYLGFRQHTRSRWSDVLVQIASSFPDAKEATLLKRAALTRGSGADRKHREEQDWQTLEYLCARAANGAFSKLSIDIPAIVKKLWPSRRTAIVDLLLQRPNKSTQKYWEQLFNGAAEAVEPADLAWISELHPDLVPSLISLRPQLAASPDLWQTPEPLQWRIVEALESSLHRPPWHEIVVAMLEAATNVGAREAVLASGAAVLDAAVDWVRVTAQEDLPTITWREALRPIAEARLGEKPDEDVELLLCLALAAAPTVSVAVSQAWMRRMLTEVELPTLPFPLKVPTAFVFVAVGLQTSGLSGARLIAQGYTIVHQALATQTEPIDSWRLLQPHLPALWFWQQWDRCEMLRQAIKIWARENPRHEDSLLQEAASAARSSLREALLSEK